MNKNKQKMPFLASRLVKWLIPDDESSFLSGDLEEMYIYKFEKKLTMQDILC